MAAKKDPLRVGPRKDALDAIRGVLADTLAEAEPPSVAGLVKEYRATLAELESLRVPEGKSAVDDLAKRRSARRGPAADPASAARRGQPRRSNGSHRAG